MEPAISGSLLNGKNDGNPPTILPLSRINPQFPGNPSGIVKKYGTSDSGKQSKESPLPCCRNDHHGAARVATAHIPWLVAQFRSVSRRPQHPRPARLRAAVLGNFAPKGPRFSVPSTPHVRYITGMDDKPTQPAHAEPTDENDMADPNQAAHRHVQRLIEKAEGPQRSTADEPAEPPDHR